jgi:hypothetical protein
MMAEGLNLILGKPTAIEDVKLPEIPSSEGSTNLTPNSTISGTNTDFSQESISDALNKFKNLSVTEKEAFWKEVSKDIK